MHPQQNRGYDILILPIDYNKSFLDCNKNEIDEYYTWFSKIKHDRLVQICSFLFLNAKDCLEESRLNVVEVFLLNSISTNAKSQDQYGTELYMVPSHLKPYVKPDDYVFDKKTISICYDIGILLGELIIRLDNGIKWKLETDKKYADYGQPVLSKKGCKLMVNPFRVTKNIAAKIYESQYAEGQLRSIFQAWKKGFKVG